MQYFYQDLSCMYLAHHELKSVSTIIVVTSLMNVITVITSIKLLHSRDLHHPGSGEPRRHMQCACKLCKLAPQRPQKETQGSANLYKVCQPQSTALHEMSIG